MTLGETIKLLRNELGLTQPELAEKAGIEQSYLSKLENDKGTPSFDIINRIAQALNLNGMGLIHKLSHSYIEENLSHLPEVVADYESVKQKRDARMTGQLLVAATVLLAGMAIFLAGQKALLDSNERFFYESDGVVLPGEHHDHLARSPIDDIGETDEEFERRLLANRGRFDRIYFTSDRNMGTHFMQELPDGKRRYFGLVGQARVPGTLNRMAEILGILCMVAGLLTGAWAIWRGRTR